MARLRPPFQIIVKMTEMPTLRQIDVPHLCDDVKHLVEDVQPRGESAAKNDMWEYLPL